MERIGSMFVAVEVVPTGVEGSVQLRPVSRALQREVQEVAVREFGRSAQGVVELDMDLVEDFLSEKEVEAVEAGRTVRAEVPDNALFDYIVL